MQNQKGVTSGLLVALASLGILSYLLISSAFPFKDKFFALLYPKPLSRAFSSTAGTPTNLRLSPVSPSQINLSWDETAEKGTVQGYSIYRNDNKIATIKTTSYGDTGLSPNTTYTYFVVTVDTEGKDSLPSKTVSTVTPDSLKSVGNIKGVVSLSSEGLLSGIRISVNTGGSTKSFFTDSKGEFYITNLPPGTYSLSVKKPGFETQNITAFVTSDSTTSVDSFLKKI